jgi:rhombotail lipoprotein
MTIAQIKHPMNIKKTTTLTLGLAAAITLVITGCDTLEMDKTQHQASSLYAYLYPNQNNHIDTPTVPVLSLPLRVGVAFVPDNNHRQRQYSSFTTDDMTISESQKMALMKQISAEFKKYPFVQSIDLIPTAYLTPGGSFANLDQIRTMYGVDAMMLLSYDQVQFTGEGLLSLTYWTVVGACIVPGEKNETKTMLDAAVFDIASRKMLFRAPGIGDIHDSAVPVLVGEQLHQNSEEGFTKAALDLTTNLQAAMVEFKERVTNSVAQTQELGTNAPVEYKVEYKRGYAGSGAISGTEAVVVAVLGASFLWTRQNRKPRRV